MIEGWYAVARVVKNEGKDKRYTRLSRIEALVKSKSWF